MTGGEVFGGKSLDLAAERRIFARTAEEGGNGDGVFLCGKRVHRVIRARTIDAQHLCRFTEEFFKKRIGSSAAERRTDEKISAAGEGTGLKRIRRDILFGVSGKLTARTDVDQHALSLPSRRAEEGCLIVADGDKDGGFTVLADAGGLCYGGKQSGVHAERRDCVLVKGGTLHVEKSERGGVGRIGHGTGTPRDTHGDIVVNGAENGSAPVRPAVVWNDHRCTAEKQAYLQEVGDAATLYEKTGWKLGTGLPLLTVRHLKDNEPEVFAKTARFLSVPDFVALRLTGRAAIDLSNAGINQLTDIRVGAHDDALLARHGYEREGCYYRAVRPNRDTVVFFCHFGLECVLLSHLLNVSPMILWHGFCAAPTSVTTLYTEERESGIAYFRTAAFGDVSHLYAFGEAPAFSARFCETFDSDERH